MLKINSLLCLLLPALCVAGSLTPSQNENRSDLTCGGAGISRFGHKGTIAQNTVTITTSTTTAFSTVKTNSADTGDSTQAASFPRGTRTVTQ
ncbi:MAG TPA: hypothetical protein VG273_19600 [Bryobacteraceae bacterium]|jgi:hypothetical protein|nr:hypothetical protein [Bryobacteraceae bacterium]